jgi:MoaA/NifB/PqqE/SkfB family radical SAM enzyme
MDDEMLGLMKESGCYQITVSIESGHPRTLERIRKPLKLDQISSTLAKIKKLDIELISNFVIGFPGETMDEIRETFRYAEAIDIDYVLFSIATPLPATELYDICRKEKCIPEDFSFETFDYYGFGRGVITTDEFTPIELQVLRAFEWDRINFKTEEKKKKIARMLGITMEELERWRTETRRSVGVNVDSADKVFA